MSSQRAREGIARGKPSPAWEAVLALIIERPSYGFEVWKRFETRFGDLYPISKGRIYQVLDQLARNGLLEASEDDSRPARQPRLTYRATAEGVRASREWLAETIRADPRREVLLRRLLATGGRDAEGMLKIVDIYERACLDDMTHTPAKALGDVPRDRVAQLRDTLIDEERRLTQEAQLKFITFARRVLRAEIQRRSGSTG